MAKMRNIIHSDDSCMMIFKGNKRTPEPSTGVIKFPGGFVEVTRTSEGHYWAHIGVDTSDNIVHSRIDYAHGTFEEQTIPPIPAQDKITKIAVMIDGPYLEPGDESCAI